MVGAAGGIVLGLALLPPPLGDRASRPRSSRSAPSPILAVSGLAIIPRYTMLAAAVLAVFAALGLLGWRLLDPGHRWRRRWQAFAGVVALMFVVWGPNQYDLLHQVDTDLTNQGEIESDLNDLANSDAFEPLCLPISVPNHRAVPRLAFDLEVRPSRIVSSSEQRQPRRGYFLEPASPFVIHNFILDPNDPTRFTRPARPGSARSAATTPGSSTAAAEAAAALDPLDRGVGSGGELGAGEVDLGRQLDVEVVRGVEPGRRLDDPRVEDVAAATALGIDEVEVVAAHLDPLRVAREPEAEHRPGDVVELEHALFGDDLGQWPVGRVLARHRACPNRLEIPVEADRARCRTLRDQAVERREEAVVRERPADRGLDRRRRNR